MFFMLLIIAVLFGQVMCELALPGYMSDIINKGIVKGDMDAIYHFGKIMIAVTFGGACCAVTCSFLASRISAKSSRDIRRALFRKVIFFTDAEMNEFSTASLITRSTNDVQMVQQTSVMVFRLAFYAPIMGAGALIKALHTNVSLTWTIGLAVAVILCIMLLAFFLVMPRFRILQQKLDRLNLIIKERLSGLLVVRAFNMEKHEEERFDGSNMDLMKINVFVNRAMSLLMPSLMLIMNVSCVLIVWAGSKLIDANNMMIGDMLAFIQYAMQIIMSFLFITMMFIMIPRAVVSGQRIGKVLETEASVVDDKNAKDIPDPQGLIEFNDVSFAYPDAEKETLSHITFAARPGQITAIIGGTGSGKSSLVNLIPRFYDVTGGSITIDGRDIRSMPQKALREKIGFVPQKNMLFSGTIASNLRFGNSQATDRELSEAAETAQALNFVNSKTDGFEEPVSEGGTTVSGGQKQRLAIARTLVKKPNVYIFDDSFSALDFKTDAALRKALKSNVRNAAIIIVAQRINTIMDADQIIVMNEGNIDSIGTHKELLKTCSIYKEIAYSQLSEEELGKEPA